MSITQLRGELEEIRRRAAAGDLEQVLEITGRALQTLEDDQLLTTTEAAKALGIRSINTVKLLVRRSGIPYEMHGNRMMIPLAALRDLQESELVRGIRASDRAHDTSEELGVDQGLSDEQLAALAHERPGKLPWRRLDRIKLV